MAGTMTVSGAVLIKAGSGVSTDLTGSGAQGLTADAIIVQFINEAESEINVKTRINYTDTYAALNADVKQLLGGIASDLAGIKCVNYNRDGYISGEANSIINTLRDSALRGLALIKEKPKTTFINDA